MYKKICRGTFIAIYHIVDSSLQVLRYPIHETCYSSVYSWILTFTATYTPTDNTDLSPFTVVEHQRTSTVTLFIGKNV